MIATLQRYLSQFFNRSTTIKNQPLNKFSLIVIIIVDIFILINIFMGLDSIGQWYLNPSLTYPCYQDWQEYRQQTKTDKDYQFLAQRIVLESEQFVPESEQSFSLEQQFRQTEQGHLGSVSPICLNYAQYQDQLQTPSNQTLLETIKQTQFQIDYLERANQTIRKQYDSTLLEKIAGQAPRKSINTVSAEQAKQKLAQNQQKITDLNQKVKQLTQDLREKPENLRLITFLNQEETFNQVKQGYETASFWYPSLQFFFQLLFLIPLIAIALFIHTSAIRQDYGLVALVSWHLLVIFLIPLLLKIFDFLQFGFIFRWIFDLVKAIAGELLFVVSYFYIIIIPLIGFGIIKIGQTLLFNPKSQVINRIQKSRCSQCAKKIHPQDAYCPYCGHYQYVECPQCHSLTYQQLPYCKQCGASQEPSHF